MASNAPTLLPSGEAEIYCTCTVSPHTNNTTPATVMPFNDALQSKILSGKRSASKFISSMLCTGCTPYFCIRLSSSTAQKSW